METTTRNATLSDLAAMLQDQNGRKLDVVAPATSIRAKDGNLVIRGTEPVLDRDGVTTTDGVYVPTAVCDGGVADKLGIPVGYLRTMRADRPDLYDANVNGWLHGRPGQVQNPRRFDEQGVLRWPDGTEAQRGEQRWAREPVPGDNRSFLVRCFRGDDDGPGIARAFLSDRYRVVDNLDVLMTVLSGIEDAGVEVKIDGADLSDRRMYVRVVAPEVQVMAENLLRGYRNPFGDDFERWRRMADREGLGYGDGSEPVVFAGFVITNSEVGAGAFSIVPRATIRVCKNGLTITKDAMRQVHLGGKLEAGVVDWSDETQEKALELVRSQTRDAVRTFLSTEYLTRTVETLEEKAGEPVASVDEVKVLTRPLKFSNDEIDGILSRFVQGGQMTRAGVVNAITAHAQTVDDPDTAHALEEQAVSLLT